MNVNIGLGDEISQSKEDTASVHVVAEGGMNGGFCRVDSFLQGDVILTPFWVGIRTTAHRGFDVEEEFCNFLLVLDRCFHAGGRIVERILPRVEEESEAKLGGSVFI